MRPVGVHAVGPRDQVYSGSRLTGCYEPERSGAACGKLLAYNIVMPPLKFAS